MCMRVEGMSSYELLTTWRIIQGSGELNSLVVVDGTVPLEAGR